jgi:hypothetical protein
MTRSLHQHAEVQEIRLAELLGALSHALDLVEGQPPGHCIRCCWIGMHIGRAIGLSELQIWELYYTLLLKDLGCSSNAARICQLYLTDDLTFKRDFKSIDGSLPQALRFVLAHTGLQAGLAERFRAIIHTCRNSGKIAVELIETRCQRGAEIARSASGSGRRAIEGRTTCAAPSCCRGNRKFATASIAGSISTRSACRVTTRA